MSNHFDGYTAARHAKLDLTDTYLFRGQTGTVMVANTNTPASDSYTGPGWDPEAIYDHNIDINGDGRPEITLRSQFVGHTHADGSPSAQRWSLSLHLGDGATDPESIGLPIITNAPTDTVHTGLGGIKAFAGIAGEPFYLPFPLVSAVATAITQGTPVDTSGHDPAEAVNAFGHTNINTIVIEIPNLLGMLNGLTIDYWASVTIPTDDGTGWRQVDRCALPMITTLYGFTETDDYNAASPAADADRFGPTIENLTAAAVTANDSHPDPDRYAQQVRQHLTPDMITYTIGTDAQMGDGQWNGRRLDEDAAGTMFDYTLNMDFDTGLDAGDATGVLREHFPYVAEPVDD